MPPKIRPKAILAGERVRTEVVAREKQRDEREQADQGECGVVAAEETPRRAGVAQWTSLKKPSMTIFSSPKNGKERSTSHLVNWSSANTTSASARCHDLIFERWCWRGHVKLTGTNLDARAQLNHQNWSAAVCKAQPQHVEKSRGIRRIPAGWFCEAAAADPVQRDTARAGAVPQCARTKAQMEFPFPFAR